MNDPTKVTAEQAEAAQKNLSKAPAKGEMVHVGCKLPNGLLLQVGDKYVRLAGANASEIVGGYGITAVPKDFYQAWAKEHENFEPLKRELIFVQGKESDAKAAAKEREEIKGIEGVDVDNPSPGAKKAEKD